MFDIPAGDFALSIEPLFCRPDRENERRHDWIAVRMMASVPHIRAEKESEMMRGEIEVLIQDIEKMYASIQGCRKPRPVEYRAMEGILDLDLTLIDLPRGAVRLTFAVWSEPANGIRLIGSVPIDQTFLPGMISGLRQLAAFE
ncbi:WapI family immunity protein [Bordetella genomosp. 13]|uniref:Uncharacterized protein n=1 Tax=Bordetella genomosp. 13 TaxID=463040 RepID=A0A1W6ZA24_9BORD|nr:hypothetical protein [Bordetella genomosp. 13]ARP94169.1 hypothetical protein CAL15_07100 [Bordetella genomosp. 13]